MIKMRNILVILSIVFIASCNEGIEPLPEPAEPGFSGTITFIGNWPQDITRTHIVMFKETLEDSTDFNIINLAYISEEIPSGVSEYQYDTFINASLAGLEPREYAYLVVAQSKTESLSLQRKDWFVIGIFCNGTDDPCTGRIDLSSGDILENINITCDFDNPPPQPPGG